MGPLLETRTDSETVDELLAAAAGKRLEVVIDQNFSLREAAEAHDYAEKAKPLGWVVMIPLMQTDHDSRFARQVFYHPSSLLAVRHRLNSGKGGKRNEARFVQE